MIKINFEPASQDFVEAANEYKKIWESDGDKIINTLNKHTGLYFIENEIKVITFEGVSSSGMSPDEPMKLRASYVLDLKRGTLIHEFCHRLFFNIKNWPEGLDSHKVIYLFLFDVWEELYGTDFANKMVSVEKNRSKVYEEAWSQSLNLSKEERKEKFKKWLESPYAF